MPGQAQLPARAPDAFDRQRGGRRTADAPARHRRRWHGQRIAALTRMALHQQRDGAPAFCRQLQSPGRRHRHAPRLAHHRAQAAMAQPFLHDREQFVIVLRFGIQDALGGQPRLIQARREQVAPPHYPQHRPPGARRDPSNEQRRGGIVGQIGARPRHFMQCIEPQPAIGQPRVHPLHAKGQHRATAKAGAFDCAQCFAQLADDGGIGHDPVTDSDSGNMFLFCSNCSSSQACQAAIVPYQSAITPSPRGSS